MIKEEEGEKINFFDQPALTTTLPAQLSTKYKLDIIPVFIERINNNNFLIEFHNRISPSKFKNKIELTKYLNQILEKMICKKSHAMDLDTQSMEIKIIFFWDLNLHWLL